MKLLVKIEEGIDPTLALDSVKQVIAEGRISNNGKQYCYLTVFVSGIVVATDLSKSGTDIFNVCKETQ